MKKMKLELEALNVESFETAGAGKRPGTVGGHAATLAPQQTCDPAVGTCFESCNCGTRYPDYCPEPTFELAPSCIDTCGTCHETCRSCWTCKITPPICP